MTAPLPVPRLLVSVRDVAEARAAAAGGADVIDFKDPARGPLGRPDFEVVASAAEALHDGRCTVAQGELQSCCVLPQKPPASETTAGWATSVKSDRRPPLPLSVALGEVREADRWSTSAVECLPAQVRWLKLGLCGLGTSADWVGEWLQVRSAIERHLPQSVEWVAVAYADVQAAAAPQIDEVAVAAIETACAGVLIDTFDKAGGRLLDHVDARKLSHIGRLVRSRGLFFAVAGRLRGSDLVRLRDAGTDIIAVRSAACAGEDRRSRVRLERVQSLQQQIKTIFAGCPEQDAPPARDPSRTVPAAETGD